MQNAPLISVIIPVYNVEKYLRECLNSVLSQTFDSIEIICVDDGSTDQSPEILKEYAQKDARIHIISKKNSGPGAARNTGFQTAQGKYIYFMDSDDTIDPDLCRMTFIAAEYSGCDILYFDCVAYDERCPVSAAALLAKPKFLNAKSFFGIHRTVPDINQFSAFAWLKLFRKEFMQRNQLGFSETLLRHEDLLFDWQCLLSEPKIGILPAKLYFYRNRPHSLMQSSKLQRIQVFEAYEEIEKLLITACRYDEFRKQFVFQKLYDFYTHGYRLAHPSIRETTRKQIAASLTEQDWLLVSNLRGVLKHFYLSLRGNMAAKGLFWFDWNVRRQIRLLLSRFGIGVLYTRFRAAAAKWSAEKQILQNRELCDALVNLQEEIIKVKNARQPSLRSQKN